MDWHSGIARIWHSLWSAWQGAKTFTLENPLDPFPLKHAVRGYNTVMAKADFRAGVNVALLGFCQGMAFAAMAGLPLIYGVMCAAVASMAGPLLASSRHTVLGPTNGTAFMIFSFFASYPHQDQLAQMPMLVFLVALLLILGAYFRVADLAQYISRSVIVAYITGASVMIAANQLPGAFGIVRAVDLPEEAKPASATLLGNIWQFFGGLPHALPWAIAISVVAATALHPRAPAAAEVARLPHQPRGLDAHSAPRCSASALRFPRSRMPCSDSGICCRRFPPLSRVMPRSSSASSSASPWPWPS